MSPQKQTRRIHELRAFMTLDAMIGGRAQSEERVIRPESRFVDKVVAFGEAVPTFFGFLAGQMANRSVIFEIYSRTPQPKELRVCLAKAVELEIEESKSSDEETPVDRVKAPMLVVISTGKPRGALSRAETLVEAERAGVYRMKLPFGVDVALIDIKQAKGDGVGGYKVLGHADYLEEHGIAALVGDPRISHDEKNLFRDTMMKFDETYDTDYTQHTVTSALEQGREEGRRAALEIAQRSVASAREQGLEQGLEQGRRAALRMAEQILGTTEGLDQIRGLDDLQAEILRRYKAQTH